MNISSFYPLIAYLAGSIPFGLIFSKLFGKGDIRKKGSGNIGATNVLRTQGKLLGLLTLIFDFSKAFLPCYFLRSESEICNLLVMVAPVVGHMFPIWLKFKGGKGVASFLGILAALNIWVLLATVVIWLSLFTVTRISSVSCLTASACSLILYKEFFLLDYPEYLHQFFALAFLVVLIIIAHRSNLKRLWEGTEKPIK